MIHVFDLSRIGWINNSLKNRWRANREDREAWRMNGLQPSPLTLIRKPLGKVGQFFSNYEL